MALLLETNLGSDLVIDLDLEGSPNLCRSVLKLAKMRYYTSSLIFNIVQPYRFCQMGDPSGTGRGGACVDGVLDCKEEEKSHKRFLKSNSAGRMVSSSLELRKRGKVVCTELMGIPDTIGSQFTIFLGNNEAGHGMDGYTFSNSSNNNNTGNNSDSISENTLPAIISLGQVTEEDDNLLTKLERAYCDPTGRPYADIRLQRVLVLHDPFEDPQNLIEYLRHLPNMKFDLLPEKEIERNNGICNKDTTSNFVITVLESPNPIRPDQEKLPERISADQIKIQDEDDSITKEERQRQLREKAEEVERRRDHSRAVLLELVGDLPDANIKVPEHILFVCKLNRHTQEEDLELIFSRFDSNVSVDLICDEETGDSLQYAFVEFTTKEQCTEAYFKMDNTLVDDRRIKVDFSQSVAKLWKKRYYNNNSLRTQTKSRYNGNDSNLYHKEKGRHNLYFTSKHRENRESHHQEQQQEQRYKEIQSHHHYDRRQNDNEDCQHDRHHDMSHRNQRKRGNQYLNYNNNRKDDYQRRREESYSGRNNDNKFETDCNGNYRRHYHQEDHYHYSQEVKQQHCGDSYHNDKYHYHDGKPKGKERFEEKNQSRRQKSHDTSDNAKLSSPQRDQKEENKNTGHHHHQEYKESNDESFSIDGDSKQDSDRTRRRERKKKHVSKKRKRHRSSHHRHRRRYDSSDSDNENDNDERNNKEEQRQDTTTKLKSHPQDDYLCGNEKVQEKKCYHYDDKEITDDDSFSEDKSYYKKRKKRKKDKKKHQLKHEYHSKKKSRKKCHDHDERER